MTGSTRCPNCDTELDPNDSACRNCGTAAPHAKTVPSGDVPASSAQQSSDYVDRLKTALADKYAITREIGHGGMATVYLADDVKHNRKVAVKVMRPELAASIGTDRFVREIQMAAQLNHPHILALHDSGEADGFLYYVMPFVEGESLRDRLNREKQLPIEEAIRLTQEVAAALSYAHSRGVVHRDIKPENILLSHGEAVLADLGIARAVTESAGQNLTETGLAMGTPTYMSPEQASGEEIDGRADIYSLSCVLFEMFTGEPPYSGTSSHALMAKHAMDAVPSPRIVRQAVPDYVESAVRKALGKVPADRFQVASQFAEALGGVSPTAMELGKATSPGVRARKLVMPGPTAPLVIVSVAAVAWLLFAISSPGTVASWLPSYVGAWLMTVLGIWFLFDRGEELANEETKKAVASWIGNWDPSVPSNWPSTFASIFDRIFGEQHLTLKCVGRSSLASLAAVITFLLFFVAANGVEKFTAPLGWILILMLLVPNIMADYISLLETRIVIKWIGRSHSIIKSVGFLIGDLVATTLIFTLPWMYIMVSSLLLDPGWSVGRTLDEFLFQMLPEMVLSFPLREGASELGVYFYSTFFTSAWLWLFLFSGLLIKIASKIGGAFKTGLSLLNVEEQPIRSLGFVGIGVVSSAFATFAVTQAATGRLFQSASSGPPGVVVEDSGSAASSITLALTSIESYDSTSSTLTASFENLQLAHVLAAMTEVAGKSIIVSDRVSGSVNVSFREQPWEEAFNYLGRIHDLSITEIFNQIFLVRSVRELQEEIDSLPLLVRLIPARSRNASDMVPIVESVLSHRGLVLADSATNMVLVYDVEVKVEEAESVLVALDRPASSIVEDEPRRPRAPRVVRNEPRITKVYWDTPYQSVFDDFALVSGKVIQAAPGVAGKVNAVFNGTYWDVALQSIFDAYHLSAWEESLGLIIVSSRQRELLSDQNEPLITRIIQMRTREASEIEPLINMILSERGSVRIDSATSTLVVTDLASRVEVAEQLAAAVELSPR